MLPVVKVTTRNPSAWSAECFFDHSRGVPCRAHFRVNDPACTSADVWFVIEDVNASDHTCHVPRERTIFLTAESAWPVTYYLDSRARRDFLAQFGRILSCHAVDLPQAHQSIPFLPWLIDQNHKDPGGQVNPRSLGQLLDTPQPTKSGELSVICSTQSLTEGHRLRLAFVRSLKEALGPRVHWYGNGVNPVATKWEAIAPYKYHIVLENSSRYNGLTEKLFDAYLGHAFPLYWGATNVGDYFPTSAFEAIHIEDINGAIRAVENILNDDSYDDRSSVLNDQRSRVLREFNPFVRMQGIALDDLRSRGPLPPTWVDLSPLEPHHQARNTLTSRARRLAARTIAPR